MLLILQFFSIVAPEAKVTQRFQLSLQCPTHEFS